MASNAVWRISWGDYDFALDRQTLTYDLIETQTGTVWASGLSVGWMELENRATGERVQHDFAQAKLVSVAEKSSAQGKRLLMGLDLLGVPIDLYFICSQREIQLTVEASRDTREFLVQDVGLLPGLVSVPDDGVSALVIPSGEGALLRAKNVSDVPLKLRIWGGMESVSMPFIGATRYVASEVASLALITDSAYGNFAVCKNSDSSAFANIEYEIDPERRRLDIRVMLLPKANHTDIALAYRQIIVAERNHVTLRHKIRDRPRVQDLIGSVGLMFWANRLAVSEKRDTLANVLHTRAFIDDAFPSEPSEPISSTLAHDNLEENPNRWEDMDRKIELITEQQQKHPFCGSLGNSDWSASTLDYWTMTLTQSRWKGLLSVPLYAAVYHDSIVSLVNFSRDWDASFLRCLLNISLPKFWLDAKPGIPQLSEIERVATILCHLHKLSFGSFLTRHGFIDSADDVEEAFYSDKTHIIINQSKTDTFEREDLHLPPRGFYVRHAQMEAHYALRVGEQTFETPAWRIRRARDGKRLEESEDVLVQEFPV